MAYTDSNNITFNSFDNVSNKFGKKLSNNKYNGATIDDIADIVSENGGKLPTIVNAIEIDWNGAKPDIGEDSTKGITTTGELLSRIKGVYSPVFAN